MQKTQLTGGNPTLEAAGVEKGGDIAFARRNVCSNAIGANAKLERSGSGYDRLIHTRPPKIHWRDDVLLVRLSLIFSVMSIEIYFFSRKPFSAAYTYHESTVCPRSRIFERPLDFRGEI